MLPSASSSTRFGEPWLVHANYTVEKSQAGDCQDEKPWSVYADYTWKWNQTSVVTQEVLPQLVYANGTKEKSLTLDKGNGVISSKGSYVKLGAWAVGCAPAAEHGAMAAVDWRWRRNTSDPSIGLLVTDSSKKKAQHLKICTGLGHLRPPAPLLTNHGRCTARHMLGYAPTRVRYSKQSMLGH